MTKPLKWIWLGLAIAVGLMVLLLPTPQGLSRTAHCVLGIAAFTVTLWGFHVINNGIASILMMALMILMGVRPPAALSGFSTPQFWILLAVLFYGFAMQSTGLARRLSFYILDLFPPTYAGILSSLLLVGLVLALGIPSMTVRTAIVVPIAWALVQAIGLEPKSRACALIMLSSVEMAVVPGCAFLYGSLFGPVVESMFRTKNFQLSWVGYAQVLAVPTLLFCVLLLVFNRMVLRPEKPLSVSGNFARDQLAALGRMKLTEMITGAVVLLSIAYWATEGWHHLPGFAVGMVALSIFALAGILRDSDIATAVPWSFLLFVGGIFSLANVIQEYKITEWLAGILVPITTRLTFSATVFVIAMALAMFLVKFLDPTGLIAITVLFLPISDVSGPAGIPPLVLIAAFVLSGTPFWFTYQNIWIAMTEGITSNQAFSTSQRIRLANTYAVATIVALIVAVGFWRAVGIL